MRTYKHTQTSVKQAQINKKRMISRAAKDINAPTTYYRHFDMKRFWIIFGVTAGIFVFLLILSSTVDFDVSWALASSKFTNMYDAAGKATSSLSYYSNNAWDNMVEAFGESLGFIICTFGLWLMAFPFFFARKGKRVWYRLASQIIIPTFLIITAIFLMYYYNNILGIHSLLKIFGGKQDTIEKRTTSLLFSGLVNVMIFVIIFFFRQTTRISLAKLGFLMVMAFIMSEVFIWVLKYQVGLNRERFRSIMCNENVWSCGVAEKELVYNYFTPWWQKTPASAMDAWRAMVPDSLKSQAENAFSSFPSGHSSLAATTMTLCFLPCCVEKAGNKKWKGYLIWLVTFGVTLTVMFSRVSAGAHWLSDTTIGLFFGTLPSLTIGLIIFMIPKVSDYFQNMNINGKWYQFAIFPVLLPVIVWLITNVLPWY